ncbi:MAG: hypothetical protein EOM23_00635 [Candidatus Moranbacteria bacterium]|nr:hypothetical protein [Candidatus Moranbacteria bacterium]
MDWESFFFEEPKTDSLKVSRKDNSQVVLSVSFGWARLQASFLQDLAEKDQIAVAEYLGSCVSANILMGNVTVLGCGDDKQLENRLLEAFREGFRKRNQFE